MSDQSEREAKKTVAETRKLDAEARKIETETDYYFVFVLVAFLAALTAFGKLIGG